MSQIETDTPRPLSDSAEILSLKYDLLTKWSHLPPEHQAQMLLILLKHTLAEQYEELRESIQVPTIPQMLPRLDRQLAPDEFEIPFAITSICRADLREVLSGKEASRFTDEDMRRLAEKMADTYVESGAFWDDLELHGQQILAEKKQNR